MKMKKELLLSMLMVMMPLMANAYDAEIDGIYYNFSGDEAEVTFQEYHMWTKEDIVHYIPSSDYTGAVVIPTSVDYDGKTYSVTAIGDSAFYMCYEITSVTLPKGLTRIGEYAFCDCLKLSGISFPEGLLSIGKNAYESCQMLRDIVIPRSVTSIGDFIFYCCANINSIKVEEGNTVYDSRSDCNAIIETAANRLIKGCDNTVIPEDITSISAYAFEQCQRLNSVTIPNGVTTIEEGTFYFCTNLKSVIIPEGVTSIHRAGFLSCHNMESVSIPSSMAHIGEGAFAGCDYLKDVYCYAEQVPETEDHVFLYDPVYKATLHVPAGSVEKYKATEPWKDFGIIVELSDLVTFTEGQMATIILPTIPDTSKGKYYRLDSCEDGKIIFEEEPNPKARIPYIIVPNQDFTIDLSLLDLTGLSRDTVSIQGISFIGSYTSEELENKQGWYVDIIDTTPDCSLLPLWELGKETFLIGALRAYLQVSKTWEQPLSVTLLPQKTKTSLNLAEAKQKLASLYKYANKYEDKLKGDEGTAYVCNTINPDSLADANMEEDLNAYLTLVGQEQDGEFSIPRELYNPDVEVEIGSDVFYYKSNSISYYRVGAGTKTIAFDNDAFSFITNKYGRVSDNDFFYLENPTPFSPPRVEIKLLGNTPSASNLTGMELPTQVMSGKYDIMVVMVPYWYKTIAEDEAVDASFYNQAYVDSVSACNKMCFTGRIRYNNNATNGKDATTKGSNIILYDGSRVDTLMVFEDFEFPYSYKGLNYSYPTLILDGATTAARSKQGFLYSLCIDRVIMRSKESGEDIVIAPEVVASYSKDQMATIILPTEPDASKGRYYRLDRCEKGKIIFEEELSPKARIPYIIVPKEDFSIDLSTLDLDGLLRDTVSVKGASFIGSYSHEELSCQDGFYIDIIDATPDCQADDSNQRKAIVGALRACLIVSWDDPYNPGGSKGITEKRELVLKDNPNGIESLTPNPSPSEKGTIYDLSGRKIDSSLFTLHSSLKRGLYIQNGKKIIVK